ncbi:hypothetical protein AtDm6_1255 [Acetobacter tropicalis]|uniref:Uncharacterized protein n=1 Tax=Acetobacter tropicalis TaxID=104102 RepID=A0A094ZQ09_9PROT|nr:hypothetical protein AtDm6_1255 [Acetobacter tropicalis]
MLEGIDYGVSHAAGFVFQGFQGCLKRCKRLLFRIFRGLFKHFKNGIQSTRAVACLLHMLDHEHQTSVETGHALLGKLFSRLGRILQGGRHGFGGLWHSLPHDGGQIAGVRHVTLNLAAIHGWHGDNGLHGRAAV